MKGFPVRAALILAALVVVTLFSAFYVVSEGQQALVVRFGQPIRVETEPGLKMEIPFVDTVTWYDALLHAMEPPTDLIILGDQKRVEVLVGGTHQHSAGGAAQQLGGFFLRRHGNGLGSHLS